MSIKNLPDYQFLLVDLKNSKHIHLSHTPDVPGDDEIIKFKFKRIEVTKGLEYENIIIYVEHPDTKEEYAYVYKDVIEVIMNDNFNEYQSKYYFKCINRRRKLDHDNANLSKRFSGELSEFEIKAIREEYYKETYRVICIKK